MNWRIPRRCGVVAVIVALAGWPTAGAAQTAIGSATAAQTTVLGSTTVLSDTGTLTGSDALQASQVTGAVPSVLTAEVLHAITIGWPDHTAAEASLAGLQLTVAGYGVSADFVMARAAASVGTGGGGDTSIDALSINGAPITVTGEPNQVIPLLGGRVVINEQQPMFPSGMAVNALHVVIDGVADVVVASATAGI